MKALYLAVNWNVKEKQLSLDVAKWNLKKDREEPGGLKKLE